MQDIILMALPIVIFAIGVGTLSSMVGIGGGIINTPLLIILFSLTAQEAPASALVAALFVAVASTYAYWKQDPRPTMVKPGLFLAITTIPGSLIGVALRTMITDDYILRLIFGISLFPVALKMLFAKKRGKTDWVTQVKEFDFTNLTQKRLGIALFGGFIGGVAAGMLGIGGGAIVVPVLSLLMGLPMHAAVATSMFTMMFTASSGTVMNIISGHINIAYSLALGLGMVIGAQIGPRFACRVNAVQLKQFFGLVLVFPLVKMMKLGQFWLDPAGENFMMEIIGDALIWTMIVIPIALLKLYYARKAALETESVPPDECEPPPIEIEGDG